MRTRCFAGFALMVLSIAWVPGTDAQSAKPRAAQGSRSPLTLEKAVDAYLAPYVSIDVFSGVVLITRDGRILARKAYGLANQELAVPNTTDGVFRIASLSKPFTLLAVGRLVDEGRLSLNDPLSRFIPDFPKGDRITVQMLIDHKAGIASINSIVYDEEIRVHHTLDSLIGKIKAAGLGFEPGEKTSYTNGGYAVLGYVIEKASGRSFGDYLREQVFAPLGMASTMHEHDQAVVRARAYGYMPSPLRRGEGLVAPYQEMETKAGGGSLVSTVDDLDRFLRAFYTDRPIKADTWRALFPPDTVWFTQGRCPGFTAAMLRKSEPRVTVVVLGNNYATGMLATIANDFASMAEGATRPPSAWRANVVVPRDSLKRFVGRYRAPRESVPFARDGVIDVELNGDDLVVRNGPAPRDVMLPQSSTRFLLRNMWSELRFQPGPNGPKAVVDILWRDQQVELERIAD